jgi:hypothetical protein
MKKFDFEVSRIPSSVQEAVMGAFAIALPSPYVAILFGDGIGYFISLADYSDIRASSSAGVPEHGDLTRIVGSVEPYLSSRNAIAAHINTATVPVNVLSLRTAAPLSGSDTLKQNTPMFRFTAQQKDICFDPTTSELRSGTYLAPTLDAVHVNTGYRAVGRYSLPCPHPARFQHEYIIPAGTQIHVGTVEPQFGQSGGGVEVRLDSVTKVRHIKTTDITDY